MTVYMTGATFLKQSAAVRSPLEPLVCVLSRFAPLSEEELGAVRALPHQVRRVEKGAVLLEGRRIEAHCYVMLDAFSHKEKHAGNLKRVVAINLPGELVNIESALAMESDYSASTFRAGEIAAIPADALRELLFDVPSLARAFWLRSQAEGAIYREWLLNDERRGLRARLAHLICETAMRLQLLNEEKTGNYVLPLDADELARAVGSIRLYVSRNLQALQEEGTVLITADGVTVKDGPRLAEIGGFNPQYLAATGLLTG